MTKIIGYFHICQRGEWRRSFDLIFNTIQNFGLYDATHEIRCGILSDTGIFIPDERFLDNKIKLVYKGKSEEYEKPTLLHMKTSCEKDDDNTLYWYVHTKGLRHYGTNKESYVIDWIKLMLYWNIIKWNLAINKLKEYDTYGCNELFKIFYSGNFWWANSKHIKQLPDTIKEHYTGPEEWILRKSDKMYTVFSSGIQGDGHYNQNYPEHLYYFKDDMKYVSIPFDFNVYQYRDLNNDLHNFTINQCLEHYLNHGINENRQIKKIYLLNETNINLVDKDGLPLDFDYNYYRYTNLDLNLFTNDELKTHWLNHGQFENRKYKENDKIPDDFDIEYYKNNYSELNNLTNKELIEHWNTIGKFQNKMYKKI
jgi:hypothetical protein